MVTNVWLLVHLSVIIQSISQFIPLKINYNAHQMRYMDRQTVRHRKKHNPTKRNQTYRHSDTMPFRHNAIPSQQHSESTTFRLNNIQTHHHPTPCNKVT